MGITDELLELATRYDELQVGAVKAVTMPSDMGSILRDAADTIWQLRDDLQRTHKLLDEVEHDESRAWDRVRKAEAESAKLRDLLSEIAKLVTNPYGGCLRPGCAHGCPHHLECDEKLHTCFYVDRMRELGVEADE